MKYDWLNDYLLAKAGAEFNYKPEWDWDRYLVRDKMFAAITTPGEKYQPPYAGHRLVNLKCDPLLAEAFRGEYPEAIHPGFYSDKRSWIAVLLDGSLPDQILRDLCDMSYRLVLEKLPKKVQAEISALES